MCVCCTDWALQTARRAAYRLSPKHRRVKEVPRSLAKLGLRMARTGQWPDAKHCLETAHELKPPTNPMMAAPELLAAKPYADELARTSC